ncbi:MAG: hypothetical protein AAFZ63_22250 [Bacteroidota bacterium]
MKYIPILLFIILSACQNVPERSIGSIRDFAETNRYIETNSLLEELDWTELEKWSPDSKEYASKIQLDSFLTGYTYRKAHDQDQFEIISYGEYVLEYRGIVISDTSNYEQDYFNRQLWQDYLKEALPDLAAKYIIDTSEEPNILKSYYRLLGLNTRDEYGWMCEYSTVGMITERREATLELVKENRVDLLKKLIDFPNTQVQLYAFDALIYIDYKMQKDMDYMISRFKEDSPEMSMQEIEESFIYQDRKRFQLTSQEWDKIEELRTSNEVVFTCGNMGSYKIYKSTTKELLSKEAIAAIITQYEDAEFFE